MALIVIVVLAIVFLELRPQEEKTEIEDKEDYLDIEDKEDSYESALIGGCTDENAVNFDSSSVDYDDGSCSYITTEEDSLKQNESFVVNQEEDDGQINGDSRGGGITTEEEVNSNYRTGGGNTMEENSGNYRSNG
jgi:hypothetical protein